MEYPKQVMKKKELEEMGIPGQWLMRVFRKHGQKVAWQMGDAKNSPILFDTGRPREDPPSQLRLRQRYMKGSRQVVGKLKES